MELNDGGSFLNNYIGDSINKIEKEYSSVDFSDELVDCIYKIRCCFPLDASNLYEIDPYDDVVIPAHYVFNNIKICEFVLNSSLLQDYKEPEEARIMLQNLLNLSREALSDGVGLVSIGD